jgi:hypothetical protein
MLSWRVPMLSGSAFTIHYEKARHKLMACVSFHNKFMVALTVTGRLYGLVVSVEDYKHRGPGFDSQALLRIFLRELGLERGPLSLVIG